LFEKPKKKPIQKSLMDIFKPFRSMSPPDILVSLIDGTKDIDLKTEISDPMGLTVLTLSKDYLKSLGLPLSSKLVESFIDIFLRYQISKDRKSREEVIRALEALAIDNRNRKEEKTSLSSKLLKAQK